MARYPGAIWKPITANKGRQRLTLWNRVNLHVAVSEAPSLFGYFNQSGIPDSHFYLRRDGKVEQYVDTAYNAFADLEGNDATISVETQGDASGKWTEAQLATLAALYAWAIETHGIRVGLARNSKLGASSKGLSWHRLGVDGNFPRTGILRGRKQRGGGMHYSTSYGKTCPGDAKIKQIPGILKAAVALEVSGGGGQSVPTPSKPKPSKPAKRRTLTEDGIWGPATTRALQRALGTTADGKISSQANWGFPIRGLKVARKPRGSRLIIALQKRLNIKADGLLGSGTVKALQRHVGTPADGVISKPTSQLVYALQARLNKGTF